MNLQMLFSVSARWHTMHTINILNELRFIAISDSGTLWCLLKAGSVENQNQNSVYFVDRYTGTM